MKEFLLQLKATPKPRCKISPAPPARDEEEHLLINTEHQVYTQLSLPPFAKEKKKWGVEDQLKSRNIKPKH